MMNIYIVNGPNINLVGSREPDIYGTTSISSFLKEIKNTYQAQANIHSFQSNSEGVLIDHLQEIASIDSNAAIIINAGAYSHTSLAIADCIKAIKNPVIEVHISNPYARESYRQHSYISRVAKACICGFGLKSYTLAIESLLN